MKFVLCSHKITKKYSKKFGQVKKTPYLCSAIQNEMHLTP
jgi:hypothetical protein